ncbi:hypothetical protein QLH51_05405 [Sphingomonas sp. 2R-10]|uniref:hypothetical protein n=1 Tax=Sphingomonas sp. 2R-10 TaxID=3045148 RepID=UPI0013DDC389|nr:hypothetical protein [Sphingomonas sp. 2R-10]MDJ0276241.1 hypothetical protein [Sphingomonas sp. 2R-10]
MLDIIVSRGRVADRSAQTIVGARLAGAEANYYAAQKELDMAACDVLPIFRPLIT